MIFILSDWVGDVIGAIGAFELPSTTTSWTYGSNQTIVLSGRFLGKLRSSSNFIHLGKIPLQTLDNNIEYSQVNVYTLLGAFGFKL